MSASYLMVRPGDPEPYHCFQNNLTCTNLPTGQFAVKRQTWVFAAEC